MSCSNLPEKQVTASLSNQVRTHRTIWNWSQELKPLTPGPVSGWSPSPAIFHEALQGTMEPTGLRSTMESWIL